MDDVSAMTSAVAAIRNAPRNQRQAFWEGVRDLIDSEVVDEAPVARADQSGAVRASVVYYIRFGDRVKIGFSTNLEGRLRAVPHDEVLAVETGGLVLERQRHRQFEHLRITGEWFALGDDLAAHIRSLG